MYIKKFHTKYDYYGSYYIATLINDNYLNVGHDNQPINNTVRTARTM